LIDALVGWMTAFPKAFFPKLACFSAARAKASFRKSFVSVCLAWIDPELAMVFAGQIPQ
jgi:hypothetical protein